MGPEEEINPYQSPMSDIVRSVHAQTPEEITARLLNRFRQQMHALGALWIIGGVLNGGLLWAFRLMFIPWLGAIEDMLVWGIACLWVVLGAATFFKRMWAVKTAIVLSCILLVVYLTLFVAAGVFVQSLCMAWAPVAILLAGILQGRRVLKWARELEHAGIPLTAHPAQVWRYLERRD
jgi:hypothetical protein